MAACASTATHGDLYRAALKGDEASIASMLSSGVANVDEQVTGRTPLLAAALAGHEGAVTLLARSGANVNAREGGKGGSREGWTPLLAASVEGHADVVSSLLAFGALVDEPCGVERQTPLQAAAEEGHTDAAAALLNGGANVDATDAEGATALLTASWLGHEDVVHLLLRQGASPDLPTIEGRSPLFAAAQEGHEAVVRALLNKGANPNYTRTQGETALYIAAHKGEVGCVEALLDNGADATLQDLEGDTPMSLAAKEGHDDLVSLLTRRCPSQLSHVHFGTTCSHEQKAAVFRAADSEISALRALLEQQAEAMAAMQAAHKQEMAHLVSGFPYALAGATAEMQRQRDAALNEVWALRATSNTAPQETGAPSSA